MTSVRNPEIIFRSDPLSEHLREVLTSSGQYPLERVRLLMLDPPISYGTATVSVVAGQFLRFRFEIVGELELGSH